MKKSKYTNVDKLVDYKSLLLPRAVGYELLLRTRLPKNKEITEGKIYIKKDREILKYTLININGKQVYDHCNINAQKFDDVYLAKNKEKIFKEIEKRGHIQLDKIIDGHIDIIKGYLKAANTLLGPMREKNKLDTLDDQFIMPVLMLFVHALELSLKILLYKLWKHSKATNCCGYSVDFKYDKKTHDLKSISGKIKEHLPKKQELHFYKDFKRIDDVVKILDKIGLDTYSARYRHSSEYEIYPFHNIDSFIKIIKMGADIDQICNSIINYVYRKEFNDCENGYFSQSTLNEIKQCLKVLKKYKNEYDVIYNIQNKRPKHGKMTVKDFFEKDHLDETQGLNKFNDFLHKLNSLELFNLFRGCIFFDKGDFLLKEHPLGRVYYIEKELNMIPVYFDVVVKLEGECSRINKIIKHNKLFQK